MPGRRLWRRVAAILPAVVGLAAGLGVLGAVATAPVQTVRYVDDDPGCGGRAPCYATIQAAVDAAAPGDRIQVAPGVYTETVVVADKGLVLEGPGVGDPVQPHRPDRHAVWVGQEGGERGVALLVDAHQGDVEGLEVRGFRIVSAALGVALVGRRSQDPEPLPGRPPSGVETRVVGAQVTDNLFADLGGGPLPDRWQGALVAHWAEDLRFENNTVVGGAAGVRLVGGSGAQVGANRFDRLQGPGIAARVHGQDLQLAGNLIDRPGGRGIEVLSLAAPGLTGTGRAILVAGNAITESGGEGIYVAAEDGGALAEVELRDNLVREAGQAGTSRGGILLEGAGGLLSNVRLEGGAVRATQPAADWSAANVYARLIEGSLVISGTSLSGSAGAGVYLEDVSRVRLYSCDIGGNGEGVHIVATAPALSQGHLQLSEGADILIGGAPERGNVLAGNGMALVLENRTGSGVSTADVTATYNDWGTAYAPVIEDQIRHRPDDPRLGLVTYLPARGVPESVVVSARPPQLVADGVSESRIRADVRDAAGEMVAGDTFLGWSATAGSLGRTGRLVEAESAAVTQRGEWGTFRSQVFGPFSGAGYLRSNQVGAELVWRFQGSALLLRYGQALAAPGLFQVRVDGTPVATLSTLGPEKRWVERLLASGLGPGDHILTLRLESGELNVDLLAAGETVGDGQAVRLRAGLEVGVSRVTATVRGAHGPREGWVEVPFTVGPPASVRLHFGDPVLPVGGVTTTVTAEVRDAQNRAVVDGTVVHFSATGGVVQPEEAPTRDGLAQTTLASGLELGTAEVRAMADGITVTGSIPLVAGPPASLEMEASPPKIPANSRAASDLVITVRDAWDHPVRDGTTVTLTTTLGTLEIPTPTTLDGVARSRLRAGAEAGTAMVEARAGAASGRVTVTLTALEVSLHKTVEPRSVVVPGEEVTFTLAYANEGRQTVYGLEIEDPLPAGLISPTLVASGPRLEQITGRPPLAWRVPRLRAHERGAITVTLRVDTTRRWSGRTEILNRAQARSPLAAELTPEDNSSAASLVVVPAAAYTVTVRAPPRLLVGGATAEVTAHVTDRFGNPALDGTPVFFSTDLGSIEPEQATTLDGTARAIFTTGVRAGTATVRALSLEQRGGFARITIAPGPATRLDLASARPWLPVGGASTPITATLADHFGNFISGAPIRFETSLGVLSETAGLTDYTGSVTTSLRSGVRTGLAEVRASGAFLSGVITIPFRAGPVAFIDLTLDRSRVSLGERVGAMAWVTDEYENPVPAEPVTFTTTAGLVTPSVALTDSEGQAAAVVIAFRSGVRVVTAAAGGRMAMRELTVDPARAYLPLVLQP